MKRFRVFAGPNGSGKSTIIQSVKEVRVNGKPVDFGIYVNADDIAATLNNHFLSFGSYGLDNISNDQFKVIVMQSGLINEQFTEATFDSSYRISDNQLHLTDTRYKDQIAQILANYLIKQLIAEGKKCSLETVFSHESKLDIMRYAEGEGYKVYLYFVATESPEINIARVQARVSQGDIMYRKTEYQADITDH